MKRIEDSYYHDDEIDIRNKVVLNITLDEAVEMLVQLKAFNIALYKEVININPEKDNVELALKGNLGMVVLNDRVFQEIKSRIVDIISESRYCNNLMQMTLTEMLYEAAVDRLYHEAKEQIQNEE